MLDTLSHHAYLIEGAPEQVRTKLTALLEEKHDIKTHGNPDFWQGEFGTFGIDEGRTLARLQSRKSFSGDKKIFIIAFERMTREAQNALLKVFEEPTEGTHFFLITPSKDRLLETLHSRLEHAIVSTEAYQSTISGMEFLEQSPSKRLETISDMVTQKDRAEARELLDELASELQKDAQAHHSALRAILRAREYLSGRAPSLKLIFEHLAVTLPVLHRK